MRDGAHALAHQCRFGGHCRVLYTVAQHSGAVADLVGEAGGSPDDALWGLLHDAPEAYLGDLPHPLKHRSRLGEEYRDVEARLQAAVAERFRLPPQPPPLVKELDRRLLATERRSLVGEAWEWPELRGVAPLAYAIHPWEPARARSEFLARYGELEERRRP
ncbi:MAG: hypothetical protein ICV64_00640 [Thermoleophilia bacterium]|nr:hypothetical protein [Thermoleophilia bacterium]